MSSDEILILLVAAVFFVLAVVFGVLLWRRGAGQAGGSAMQMLQQQMADSSVLQDQRLGRISEQLTTAVSDLTKVTNERLTQSQMLAQQSQKAMVERLDSAGKTIADLKGQLGQLSQATQYIAQVGSEMKKLQDILQSPKPRGGLGEWSLENLLADVLPSQHYQLQHRFKDGNIVDAFVNLAQGNVCIDAKFPLANFQIMLQEQEESGRNRARKAFLRDVCKRIDEIADKYILPREKTLDFALMYVPAENVYYEATITAGSGDIDVNSYGRQRKVILVSPNTLYAYLMVIATGLKGLQIERNAHLIRQNLSQLHQNLRLFINDFALVGKHLNNARVKYDESGKKLDLFDNRLGQLGTDTSEPTSEPTAKQNEVDFLETI